MPNKYPIFPLRLPPELRAQAEKRAEKQDRSVTSYIVQLIRKDLEKGKGK